MIADQSKEQIWQSFQADEFYRNNEKSTRENCVIQLQISKYDQKVKENDMIINASDQQQVFYICGKHHPEKVQDFNKVFYYLISLITPKLNQGYTLVYFNNGLYTHSNLAKFYNLFKELPVEYFQNLEKIYIVQGNMFIKSWFWFNTSIQIKTLKGKTVFLSKIQNFSNYSFFNQVQLEKIPNYCLDGTMNNLKLKQLDQPQIIQVIGLRLDQYELNTKGIPLVLDIVVSKFLGKAKNLEIEGIFRINSACTVDKELERILNNQQYQQITDFEDDIALANFTKRFFDKLELPLFPFELYQEIVQTKEPTIEGVIDIISKLPQTNQQVLAFLITLLYKCQLMQNINKMTSYNLAVIFGISIIRPKVFSQQDFVKYGNYCNLV